jgi:hypothetical protein
MKLTFFLWGDFSYEQNQELGEVTEFLSIDWKMPFLPNVDDSFELKKFTDILPEFCNYQMWIVESRSFLDHETVELTLKYI